MDIISKRPVDNVTTTIKTEYVEKTDLNNGMTIRGYDTKSWGNVPEYKRNLFYLFFKIDDNNFCHVT